jgi:hypothetical protein
MSQAFTQQNDWLRVNTGKSFGEKMYVLHHQQ